MINNILNNIREKLTNAPKGIDLNNIFRNFLLKKIQNFLYSHESSIKIFKKLLVNNYSKVAFGMGESILLLASRFLGM